MGCSIFFQIHHSPLEIHTVFNVGITTDIYLFWFTYLFACHNGITVWNTLALHTSLKIVLIIKLYDFDCPPDVVFNYLGAGRSSEVERSLMVRWVVGSILHGVDPLSYISFQPVLHDWCIKGRGMCYPVCGMVHIKEPLLLIDKSSLCGGSGFPYLTIRMVLNHMSDAI